MGLTDEQRWAYAGKDYRAVLQAKIFWLLVPREPSIGCWVELGVAYTRGIQIIVRQCRIAGVACFVKQLGSNPMEPDFDGIWSRVRLKDRHGGDMTEWPEHLRVREFPRTPQEIPR